MKKRLRQLSSFDPDTTYNYQQQLYDFDISSHASNGQDLFDDSDSNFFGKDEFETRMKRSCISPRSLSMLTSSNRNGSKSSMYPQETDCSSDSSTSGSFSFLLNFPLLCQIAPQQDNLSQTPTAFATTIAPPIAPDCWKKQGEVNEEYTIRNWFLGKLHLEKLNRMKVISSTSTQQSHNTYYHQQQPLNSSSFSTVKRFQGGNGVLGTR